MGKKVKRKISIKGLLFLILIIYLIGSVFYYLFTMPIKNIIINGNNYVTDEEIIKTSALENYPNIFKISSLKIKKELKQNTLIKDVKISKNLLGKITINITENEPLFYNTLTHKTILEDERDTDKTIIGIPTLINYVPTDIYSDLINGLSKIDRNILTNISEIEYSPSKNGEIVFDELRFILRMNDGNTVYINTPNIKKLNNYNIIYSEISGKGILYLDSASDNYIFKKE